MANAKKVVQEVKGLDVFAQFATDEAAELEGVNVDLGGGASIKVARAHNDNYALRISEEYDKNRQALDAGTPEAKELDRQIMLEVLAETVLVGFENLKYKGEMLPYTKENAVKFLAIKDFRRTVLEHANRFELYQVKAEEADRKN